MSEQELKLSPSTSLRIRVYVLQRDRSTIVGDLTGYAVTLTLSASPGSTTLYSFTGTVVTPSTALVEVSLTPDQVDTIAAGNYWYTLRVDAGGANGYKPLEGVLVKGAA